MDFIINECSLHGQYQNCNEFSDSGVASLNTVLSALRRLNVSVLLKKSTLYNRRVTEFDSYHDVVFGRMSRLNDRIRKMKGLLASLMSEPFWDDAPKQNTLLHYYALLCGEKTDVTSTSIAEAQARKACLVSFIPSDFQETPINVQIEDEAKEYDVYNIWQGEQVREVLLKEGIIGFKEYFCGKYSKLDFSCISDVAGFNLIDNTDFSLFKDTFRMFDSLTWQQILVHDGLSFKAFNMNRKTIGYFTPEQWKMKIFKFRVTDKIRCFGYRVHDVFCVLRIDLTHKLSDKG